MLFALRNLEADHAAGPAGHKQGPRVRQELANAGILLHPALGKALAFKETLFERIPVRDSAVVGHVLCGR